MKNKLKNVLFALAGIILVLALLEGGSRLYQWFQAEQMQSTGRETLAFRAEDLSPYVFFRELPSLELRPNAEYFFKFDGRKVTAKKSPGEYRIFIMGGSVAKGYGASAPEKKYYRILENLLNENLTEAGRNFKVVSAGRLGYVSAQELIFLLMGVLDFRPDMVIHLNGVNDIMAVTLYNESPGHPFYFQSLTQAIKAVKIGKTLDKTLEQSAFLSELNKMFKKYRASSGQLTVDNIVRHYTRNMTQAAQILNANNIEALFILQPILLHKKTKSPREQAIANHIKRQARHIWNTTYLRFAESLEKISRERKIHWQDFQGVFDETPETIFNDSVHFNDRGQEILARALFEEIKSLVHKE